LPFLIDMGGECKNNAEHITKPTIYTPIISVQVCYLLAELFIYKEEARMVFKTGEMPSWYAWPARNCLTVPFALEKAN